MYKSPIEIMQEHMQCQMDDGIYKAVLNYGINVDKEELLRALKYDREQYEAGYRDGKLEAIKHGRWIWDEFNEGYYCPNCVGIYWKSPDVPNAFKRCPNCGARMIREVKRMSDYDIVDELDREIADEEALYDAIERFEEEEK